MKKAQGLSLQVVIVAVLVLVVLVVLVLIFSGKLKVFGSTTSDTTAKFSGNNCVVPGTNNECVYNTAGITTCKNQGGAYSRPAGGYDDCGGEGCCLM